MRPLVSGEPRDAVQHAERLDRPRSLDGAHVLGVPAEILEQNGAVSEPVVLAMAEGVLKANKPFFFFFFLPS